MVIGETSFFNFRAVYGKRVVVKKLLIQVRRQWSIVYARFLCRKLALHQETQNQVTLQSSDQGRKCLSLISSVMLFMLTRAMLETMPPRKPVFMWKMLSKCLLIVPCATNAKSKQLQQIQVKGVLESVLSARLYASPTGHRVATCHKALHTSCTCTVVSLKSADHKNFIFSSRWR